MRTLSRRQVRVLRAIAGALFFDGEREVSEDRLRFTVVELGEYLRKAGLQTRIALRFALLVIQFAPLLFRMGLQRFTSLPRDVALRCLERLQHSRLGLVVVMLKTMLCFVFYEHPGALAETGYDGEGYAGPAWPEGGRPPVATSLRVVRESAG